MYCRKCGVQMPDDSRFCTKCGTPVSDETQVHRDTFAETSQDFWKKSPVNNNAAANAPTGEVNAGSAGNIINVGEMTVDCVNDPTLSEEMYRGPDGTIYWHYTQDMWKHPTDLLMLFQIYVIIFLFFVLIGLVMLIVTGEINGLLEISKDGAIVLAGLCILTAVIWALIVLGRGGKKEMDF